MKNSLFAVLALALCFTACQPSKPPTARLESSLDTLAYCLGAINAVERSGLVQYLERVQSDSNCVDDFLCGLTDALEKGAEVSTKNNSDKASIAYDEGVNVGLSLLDRMISRTERMLMLDDSLHLNPREFAAGFCDVVYGKQAIVIGGKKLSRDELSDLATALNERISDERAEVRYGKEKAEGLDFIKKKSNEPGVKPLSGGIYYKELQAGHGASPTMTSKVQVRYEGRLISGKLFDATANHGGKAYDEFTPDRVIKGWQEALTHMAVGSKWEVYIPYDKAYGAAGNPPDIPPFSTLIFTMELISFE